MTVASPLVVISLFDILVCRQYFRSVCPYRYHMLKVSRRFTVCCPDCPPVLFLYHLPGTHIDHRFNGEHHAGHELYAFSPLPVVRHLRILMKVFSNPMAHQLAYNTVAKFLDMALDRVSHIARSVASPGLFDAKHKCLVRVF